MYTYMYMYVCMNNIICICMCWCVMYTYTYVCTYVHVCVRVLKSPSVSYASEYVMLYAYMWASMYTCMWERVYNYGIWIRCACYYDNNVHNIPYHHILRTVFNRTMKLMFPMINSLSFCSILQIVTKWLVCWQTHSTNNIIISIAIFQVHCWDG